MHDKISRYKLIDTAVLYCHKSRVVLILIEIQQLYRRTIRLQSEIQKFQKLLPAEFLTYAEISRLYLYD